MDDMENNESASSIFPDYEPSLNHQSSNTLKTHILDHLTIPQLPPDIKITAKNKINAIKDKLGKVQIAPGEYGLG